MTQKIRMNTELRNKLFNKIKHTFENEDTQEREAYLQSREYVDEQYDLSTTSFASLCAVILLINILS